VILVSGGHIIADGTYYEVLSDTALIQKASLTSPQIAMLMLSLKDLGFNPKILDIYQAKADLEQRLSNVVYKDV
jgi:hypothetical protein